MGIFSKFCRSLVDEGGVALLGIFGTLCFLNGNLPSYMGPVAYGITTFGILGVFGHLSKCLEKNKCEDLLIQLDNLQRILVDERSQEGKPSEIPRIIAETGDLVISWRNNSRLLDERIAELKELQSKLCLKILKTSFKERMSKAIRDVHKEDEDFPELKNVERNASVELDEKMVSLMVKEYAEYEDERLNSLSRKVSELYRYLGLTAGGDCKNAQGHSLKAF